MDTKLLLEYQNRIVSHNKKLKEVKDFVEKLIDMPLNDSFIAVNENKEVVFSLPSSLKIVFIRNNVKEELTLAGYKVKGV